MTTNKLRIKSHGLGLRVNRPAIKESALVYIVVSNRPFKYGKLYSRIAYIGTTKNGIFRIAASAASRAELLNDYGVQELSFHIFNCKGRQNCCTWKALEAGMLTAFIDFYGELPKGNKNGPGEKYQNQARNLFNWETLKKRLHAFSQ